MGEWISVKERLPEDAKQKIVCHSRGVSFGRYIEDAWYSSIGKRHCVQSVTHWMPLPQPPKEEDNGR